jgi:hypothetical protein
VAATASVVPILNAAFVPMVVGTLFLALLVRGLGGDDDDNRRWLLRVVMLTFGARILVSLVIAGVPALVDTFGPDATTYHRGALDIVHGWDAGIGVSARELTPGKEGFFYMLAGLYYVLGPYLVSGLVVNAALSAALLPIAYDTTRRLFGTDAARVAVILTAILPAFFVWTSQLLREAPVLFLLAVAANAATRLTVRTTIAAYTLLVGSLALLFTLRANVALIASAGLIVGLVFGRRRLAAGVAAGAAMGTFVVALIVAVGIGYAGFQAATGADLEQVSAARRDLSTGVSSGYAPNQDVSSTQKAITFLPIALPSFLFGPFPWQARNATQIGGVLEAMSLWILAPSAWWGLRRAGQAASRRWFVLAGPAVLLAVSLSLLIGNFGAIVRERVQVTLLLIPVIAYGWTLRHPSAGADDTAAANALDEGAVSA